MDAYPSISLIQIKLMFAEDARNMKSQQELECKYGIGTTSKRRQFTKHVHCFC